MDRSGTRSLLHQMLSIATLCNRKDLASYCLEQGASLDSDDIYSIYRCIIGGKSFTTCKFLVAEGLYIKIKMDWMFDILTTAVEQNHLPWAKFCLENGANPNQILIWIHIVLSRLQPGMLLSNLYLCYSSTMQH